MSKLFGIEESRWLPQSKSAGKMTWTGLGRSRGRHAKFSELDPDRSRVLKQIWNVWTFRSGVTIIALGLTFAILPKSRALTVLNWTIGTLLFLACIFTFTFQVVVGTKLAVLYFRQRRR
jgi:hypothetical protein